MLDVVLEILNDCRVVIELHDLYWDHGSVGRRHVKTTESQKIEFAAVVVIIVVDEWRHNPDAMFPRLVDCPVDRIKSLLVVDPQGRHDTERVAHAYSERLTSDSLGSHGLKGIHDFGNPAKCWIACIERGVEWLASWWDNVFVETKPVHICTTGRPTGD